jgi:hypothetical protein
VAAIVTWAFVAIEVFWVNLATARHVVKRSSFIVWLMRSTIALFKVFNSSH